MVETRHDGMRTSFLEPETSAVCDAFLQQGYHIGQAENRAGLDLIQARMAEIAAEKLGLAAPNAPQSFLDGVHDHVSPETLNDLRLHVFHALNREPWLRPTYLSVARRAVEALIGNELAMQRRINLSIQLPGDDSSILPLHADVWSGDSPYELVLWIPLVDCHATKSMFILPRAKDLDAQARMADFDGRSVEDLYRSVEPDVIFLDVPYGSFLLFTQNQMHGNRINGEPETRWSMNCRLKAALSPYADKRVGEFFEPITLKPATYLGMTYELPKGFKE